MIRLAWLILRKDLTVEVRSGEIAYTTLFFAVTCVLVFAFALVREGRPPEDGAAGILWIAIAFAGNLALGRAFERERQAETLRALLLAPTPRPAVYLGKLLGIVVLLAGTEAILVPLIALLFQAQLLAHPFWLSAILAAGTIGFAAVGTLFAAMTAQLRARELLFPVLLLPAQVPVLLATVSATQAALAGQPLGEVSHWLRLLVAADVVYVVIGLLTFEFILEA
jgi:heme exporter protein CcmB